jgi:hypothetical protein
LRVQLRASPRRRTALIGVVAAAGLVAARPAAADGTVTARAVYYKERSTRVMQPMLDGMFEVGSRGLVTAHFLVDSITSASASSGAAGKPFTERRIEAGAGYARELARLRLKGEAKYSTESDYRSIYVGGGAEADLAQKNAVVGLGGGYSRDRVDNAGAQGLGAPQLQCKTGDPTTVHDACPLAVWGGYASASQILSRDALVAATYDVSYLDGYQANPYRTAITGDGLAAERHPNTRLRQAIAASGRLFVPATETTFIVAYRYYRDDWGVRAHTPELRIVQQVGDLADASIRYRYHTQRAASFYEKTYPTSDPAKHPYLSDDVKLSSFDGHILEAKLGVYGEEFELPGRGARARFEGILEYDVQYNRFGNAFVAHVALTLPLTY